MRIEIRSQGVEMSRSLRERVRRRVRLALDRHAARIERVRVHFVDENGPRGGIDHRCSMTLSVRGHGRLVVSKSAEEPEQALQRASESAARTVARRASRAFEYRRQASARRLTLTFR